MGVVAVLVVAEARLSEAHSRGNRGFSSHRLGSRTVPSSQIIYSPFSRRNSFTTCTFFPKNEGVCEGGNRKRVLFYYLVTPTAIKVISLFLLTFC